MPRGGPPSYTYTLPAVYLAVPGTTILVQQHNTPLEDIEDVLNDPWPVVIGGTGGTSAITAWDAINTRGANVPTAATLDLDSATGANLHLTGTTGVTAVSLGDGNVREVISDGAFAFTASATLIVNGQTSGTVPVAAGSYLFFVGGTGGAVYVSVIASGSGTVLGYTTTATAAGTTTLTKDSTFQQFFTGSTTQTIVMPVASTLTLGWTVLIVNNSTGALTINSSGANLIVTLAAGMSIRVTCILLSGTTAASWSANALAAFTTSAGVISTTYSNDGATVGPVLILIRESASGADDDLGPLLRYNMSYAATGTEYPFGEFGVRYKIRVGGGGEVFTYGQLIFRGATGAADAAPSGVTNLATLDETAGLVMGTGITITTTSAVSFGSIATTVAGIALPSASSISWAASSIGLTGTSGNLALSGGAADLVLDLSAATAGQIAFPATQNASAGANVLDDYEETPWTPVLTFATPGNLNVVYSSQVGTCTKVGRLVTVTFDITTSTFTHTTASGSLNVTGLPFTPQILTGYFATAAVQFAGVTKTNYTSISAQVGSNSTNMSFNASGSGQALSAVAFGDMPTGGTVTIRGTLQYEAAT